MNLITINRNKKKKQDRTKVQYNSQLEKIACHFEKIRLADYIETMNKPSRIIWVNLLAGISRGVGLTVGATLVIAILFKILSALISMNIPYLTDMLQEIVQIIKATPAGGTFVIPEDLVTSSVAEDMVEPTMPEETVITVETPQIDK